MTRYEFISALKDKLYLLNENECRDIIEEYMAHIDMKMAEGKSEAEAIKDFGDIGDLASEILAAYHIDSTKLNDMKQQKEKSAETAKNTSGKITEKAQKIKTTATDKINGFSQKLDLKKTEICEKTKNASEKTCGWFKKLFSGTSNCIKSTAKTTTGLTIKISKIFIKLMAFACLWAPCVAITFAALVCTAIALVIYFTTGVGFVGVCIAGVGGCIICCGITLWLTELLSGGKVENA